MRKMSITLGSWQAEQELTDISLAARPLPAAAAGNHSYKQTLRNKHYESSVIRIHVYPIHAPNSKTNNKKSKKTQRGTCNSGACLKARCE